MNKKRKIIIVAIIIALVIIGLAFASNSHNNSNDTSNSDEKITDEESNDSTIDENNENSDSTSNSNNNTQSNNGSSSNGQIISEDSITTMGFPYTDVDQEIVVEDLMVYSGYYIEDGSDEEIDSVAMLEVTNTSNKTIEYGTITINADNQTLEFNISLIPSKATVMVMEANKKTCSESANCTYGKSEIAYLSNELDLCENLVNISVKDGAITVKNISESEIPELRLFYKNKMDSGEYVGGIAYTVKIDNLSAGASETVYPSHFDPDYGVVLMVRTYD